MSLRFWITGGLFSAALAPAFFLKASPFELSRKPDRPMELLQQSYDLGKQLNPFAHTYYLRTLLSNSTDLVSHERYEQWCDEMWQASAQLTDGWSRVAEEKNSALFLSRVNPARAMQLLSQIEDPQPDSDGTFPEDVRADGARTIFVNYWKSGNDPSSRLKLLPVIEEEARRLGQTGEYPYAAMGIIVQELGQMPADASQKEINAIFAEGLQFYKAGSHKFLNRNRMFAGFLKATKSKVIDPNLLHEAVHVVVEKVLNSPKDMEFGAEIETPRGTIWFADDRTALLFTTFPSIREIAPQFADELVQKHPKFELEKAVEPITVLSSGFALPGQSSLHSQSLHGKLQQISTINKIKQKVQQNDFPSAQGLTQELTDDASHIEGSAVLVSGIAKSDPEQAKHIYYSERTRLQEISDQDEHLRAVVNLAKASLDIHDTGGLTELTSTALGDGAALFEEDSRQRPQWTPSERRGFKDLRDVVTLGAAHGLELLSTRVQQLQDIELKANMLVFEAKAMADAQAKNH